MPPSTPLDPRVRPHLEREQVDVSGLEPGPERRVERVALVTGHRKSQRDHPEAVAHSNQFPRVQLLLAVFLGTGRTDTVTTVL